MHSTRFLAENTLTRGLVSLKKSIR